MRFSKSISEVVETNERMNPKSVSHSGLTKSIIKMVMTKLHQVKFDLPESWAIYIIVAIIEARTIGASNPEITAYIHTTKTLNRTAFLLFTKFKSAAKTNPPTNVAFIPD